ncbi:MAG: response regulator transcription factor [Azonexus sp.]|jgi:two-component system, OmpR family, response regulator RegX3|nr:response regulator transcription factor [Azonexus sp.]
MKFAIIESSRRQAEILKALLKSEGHQSEVFAEGRACLDVLDEAAFDFFIFDWGMLDISGSELLQEIRRRRGWQVPVVVSSALTSEENAADVLRAGADDFIPKPIRYMEFMARIEALLRHSRPDNATTLRVGNIEIDLDTQKILLGGADVGLTRREFDLATLFLTNVGRIFSREELLKNLWQGEIAIDTRTVDTHSSRVRKKLGLDGGSGLVLSSVYGKGYRLDTVQTD